MSALKTTDISEEMIVGESGYTYLEGMAAKLNKKATKWGVPPMEVKVVKVDDIPIKGLRQIFRKGEWIYPIVGYKKRYTVQIVGKAPQVEGYEFVAKIQHAPEGNLLNYAPGSSVHNLPEHYRTDHGDCDICKQKRERFNTFILKLTQDDPARFSDKKSGDFVMVGSACLARFLPGISVNVLLNYAKMIESMRQARVSSGEYDDDDNNAQWWLGPKSPNRAKHHIDIETLLYYISAAYVVEKKFVSKTKAHLNMEPATADLALDALFLSTHYINDELQNDKKKAEQAAELTRDVSEWMQQTDFKAMGANRPDMADYFHNLQIISRATSISWKNIGFLGGIFSSFLRKRDQAAKAPKVVVQKNYVGEVGKRFTFKGSLVSQKYLPGGMWGDSWLYKFQDDVGNDIVWFSTRDQQIDNGTSFEVTGSVKRHEISKYTQQPQTLILRAKLKQV